MSDANPALSGDHSLALVLVVDPEFASPEFATHLRDLYGFSAAEAKVASFLKHGPHLGKIAEQIGVSRNTIRSQVKMLCQKTGSNRTSDLLWRLNSCVGVYFLAHDWLSSLSDLVQ